MANTRFKGSTSSEQLDITNVKQNDMIQARHDIGGSGDSDKGIPFGLFQAMPVGSCSTSASTVAKVATIDSNNSFGGFTLVNGRMISIKFTNANTATDPTLNVNSTGALPIKLDNQASSVHIGSGCWSAGAWIQFKYVSDGTNSYWLAVGHELASTSSETVNLSNGDKLYRSNDLPFATCTDSATTQNRTATISNYSSYTVAVGTTVKVSFTNKYTPSTNVQMYLSIGGTNAPCTAHGRAMKQGCVYDGMIATCTYTGSAWNFDVDVCERSVGTNSGYTIYSDGTCEDWASNKSAYSISASDSIEMYYSSYFTFPLAMDNVNLYSAMVQNTTGNIRVSPSAHAVWVHRPISLSYSGVVNTIKVLRRGTL